MTITVLAARPDVQIQELHFALQAHHLALWCSVGLRTLHVTVTRGTSVTDPANLAVVTVREPGHWPKIATEPPENWYSTINPTSGPEPYLQIASTLIERARAHLKI